MDALRCAAEFVTITEQTCPRGFHWGEIRFEECKTCFPSTTDDTKRADCWEKYFLEEAEAK